MLTIWGRRSSVNVQKVMWCIAELGLPYERHDAGLAFGKNNEDWYRSLNPNGKVPLLVDGDFSLWESNTIVRYLAAKHGLGSLCPERLEERALAERWMDWQLSTLAAPMGTVYWNLVRTPEPERDREAIARCTRATNDAMLILDGHLACMPFAAGERFTMGDIPVGAMARRWLALPGVERPPLPNVEAWQRRLTERAAFRSEVMLPLT